MTTFPSKLQVTPDGKVILLDERSAKLKFLGEMFPFSLSSPGFFRLLRPLK